jgi:hypothetical protein
MNGLHLGPACGTASVMDTCCKISWEQFLVVCCHSLRLGRRFHAQARLAPLATAADSAVPLPTAHASTMLTPSPQAATTAVRLILHISKFCSTTLGMALSGSE